MGENTHFRGRASSTTPALFSVFSLSMDILKIRYCGRVSAGMVKRFRPTPVSNEKPARTSYLYLVLRVFGLKGVIALRSYLGLSSVSKSQKPIESTNKSHRGSKGISSRGRLFVKDAASILEDSVPGGCLVLLTLTIPPEAMKPRIFEHWSKIAKNLKQRLAYALQAHGLPGELIGVVEIQEHRQSGCGELPALHWHIVFQGRKKYEQWALSIHYYRDCWKELLERELGFPVDCKAAIRVERVRESASSYLAKYMSKGVGDTSQINTNYLPKSWYMCTSGLRDKVKDETVYITGTAATTLYELLRNTKGWLRYSKDITLTTGTGREITIGWYGDFSSRDKWRDFVDIARSLSKDLLRPVYFG